MGRGVLQHRVMALREHVGSLGSPNGVCIPLHVGFMVGNNPLHNKHLRCM